MTDIIVKIMAEVISILGIVTKEIRQGRTSTLFLVVITPKADLHTEKYLKKLAGRNDVEDAFRRLDKLTPEEALMAAAETMTMTRNIDDKVKDVDTKMDRVDERVQSIDLKTEGIEDKVQIVDDKVQGVDERVKGVDERVKGVDERVKGVDERVMSVDGKVVSVIKGEPFSPSQCPLCPQL